MDKNMENEMETGGIYGFKDLVASTNMFSWSLASKSSAIQPPYSVYASMPTPRTSLFETELQSDPKRHPKGKRHCCDFSNDILNVRNKSIRSSNSSSSCINSDQHSDSNNSTDSISCAKSNHSNHSSTSHSIVLVVFLVEH